jgi:predicted Zn-dependent protease with MMP-like domain
MTPDLFMKYVEKALNELPDEFRNRMENIEIVVEDFPDSEVLASMGLESRWSLLGLYTGVPYSERSFFQLPILPESIILYSRPILRSAGSMNKLSAVIREVLYHEIGHHFGFDDEELENMSGEND